MQMYPRKRLGQHFLVDHNIANKIIGAADLAPHETVLEIGPGRGILTRKLCERVAKVVAVEVDPRCVDYLNEALSGVSNLDLQCGDALKLTYDQLPEATVVVANLPYNISTPLLFQFLGAGTRIQRMVLMVQREVAKRLVAPTGAPEYGVLSVLVQQAAVPRLLFSVSPRCFSPVPEVDSAVVRLDRHPDRSAEVHAVQGFTRIVRAAFGHRRKYLSNSLCEAGYSPAQVRAACQLAGIDGRRRAETLSIQEFARLSQAFLEGLR